MKCKKMISVFGVACLMMTTTFCAFPELNASAEDEKIHVEIEQKQVSLNELESIDYAVPIFVSLTENPGITNIQFCVSVDERCNYHSISWSDIFWKNRYIDELKKYSIDESDFAFGMEIADSSKKNASCCVWGSSSSSFKTGKLFGLIIYIPEDAQIGDKYVIQYLNTQNVFREAPHIWYNYYDKEINIPYDYGAENNVEWTDGYIEIVASSETPQQEAFTLGDADGSGSIDILDVITLNKAILGKEELSETQLKAIDFNGNGKPDSEESLKLMKYIVGLITSFTE